MLQILFPPEFLYLIERLSPLWQFLGNWWWFFLPFLLWKNFKYHYLFWRNDCWYVTNKIIFLEIKMPKEVVKPIRAMDQVLAGIHAVHDVITWREKWIEGQFQLSISLEIVSIDGEVHFFIRMPEQFRQIIESNIYSQYPEAEISQVEDYTKTIPQDIPNKEWDLYGVDMINTKEGIENPYPIRTYVQFETEREPLEEKRLDPLSELLEGMASLGPGEQIWVQFIAKPIREEIPWVEKGRELVNELAKRPKKPVPKPILLEAADVLITGKPAGVPEEKKEEIFPPEMRLTPGEKEIVSSIEEKIKKFGYVCTIRFLYLGHKDIFFKPKARIPYGFFKEVSHEGLGGLKPNKTTLPKVKSPFFWFFDAKRVYMRKRRLLRRYIKRFPPYYPRPKGNFILNTEELATLYHFPGRMVVPAPAVPRIEAKKGEPPPGLPVE